MNKILYLVVPCYNEEEVLPETAKRLLQKVTSLQQSGEISSDSRIVFVNDGSRDKTWSMIENLYTQNPCSAVFAFHVIKGIKMLC